MALEGILKKWGLKGLIVAVLILGGWWYFTFRMERSDKPGWLIVHVQGAAQELILLLDNRNPDIPRSKEFFRIDDVKPGLHLVELRTETESAYSTKVNVAGGTETQHLVDLRTTSPLPDLGRIPHGLGQGWIFLGVRDQGSLSESVLVNAKIPMKGQVVTLELPVFVRAKAAPGSEAAEAFASIRAGDTVKVSEIEYFGEDVWARVEAEAKPRPNE